MIDEPRKPQADAPGRPVKNSSFLAASGTSDVLSTRTVSVPAVGFVRPKVTRVGRTATCDVHFIAVGSSTLPRQVRKDANPR